MYELKQDSMSGHNDQQQPEKVAVWDIALRIFHWSMVCAVTVAAITGYLDSDWLMAAHVFAGYAIGYLLVFRLLWGFTGSYYSRFSSFPLKSRDLTNHLLSVFKGNPRTYTGHNPAGAWMILILLLSLFLVELSGFVVLGGEENQGPLASVISSRAGDFAEDVHETIAAILMVAIGVHLLGVFVEVKIFRHPVLKAMISGKKPIADDYIDPGGPGILRRAYARLRRSLE